MWEIRGKDKHKTKFEIISDDIRGLQIFLIDVLSADGSGFIWRVR